MGCVTSLTRKQLMGQHSHRLTASVLVSSIFSSITFVVSSLATGTLNVATDRASGTVLYQQIQ